MTSTITEFAHLQIPLEEVVKATNNFDDKNIIGEGDFGKVYRGQLLRSGKMVNIAARRLDRKHGQGDVEFWTEISVLSSLDHENIVSIIGFCDENGEKIIINTDETKGSVLKYLSDPTFTWIQRLNICVGVARALRYIHNGEGRGYSVMHRNINSSTILLDDNWVPKLSGFEFLIKQSVNRTDRVLLSEAVGTTGYMDPEIEKTGAVTHKSDIYSFGVVLCEILCGRKAFIPDADNRFLAPLFRIHYENRTLNDIIHPDLRYQMAQRSLTRFSKAAYSCIKEERVQRPNMNDIVDELEKALEVQQPLENLRKKVEHLEHLKIPLSDIKLATDNFSDASHIRDTGYYNLYRAELEHFDKENPPIKEGELPRRRSTVVVKRIIRVKREGEEEYRERGFYTEIQMHATCNHPNILKLLGFCDQGSEMILVIEYLSNGYLTDYWRDTDMRHILTWEKRLKICLDVANALNYIHSEMEDQKMIIHRDIRSLHIVLDENWGAKIIDFGLSVFLPPNQDDDALYPNTFAGTPSDVDPAYVDPEYEETGKLKRESDVYSFGVVLFEVLCGRLIGVEVQSVARQCFQEGTLMEMIDPILKEESGENSLILNRGPNKDSLEKFVKIAHECIAETQDQRPTMKAVIQELQKALFFQTSGTFGHLQIRLEEIVSATSNFADENLIKQGRYGNLYKGLLSHSGELIDIIARRLDCMYGKHVEFWTEISMLSDLEHKHIASIVGFCFENDENILIYKHVVHGSLDQLLNDATLTWFRRLQICLGAARALSYIHYDVIHCNINSSKIFVDTDWEAKVFGFELSTKYPESWRHRLLFSQDFDKMDYIDPVYMKTGIMTPKYDVYSFGVILFEVLGVRKAIIADGGVNKSVAANARDLYQEKKLDEMIDASLRRQMDSNSLNIFSETAFNCLEKEPHQRPTMDQVVKELEDALEFQWKRENIEHSAAADEDTLSNRIKHVELLRIQFIDIKSATDSFNEGCCIGSGGYGKVYKADLEHLDIQTLSSTEGKNKDELPKRSSTVAIKRILNRQDEQAKQGFLAEIQLLTSCKHHNIVSLLGFSNKDREMIIVYEFLSNGSLDEHFGSTEKKINLTWNQRLRICLDIAEGLKYLHTNMQGKPRIIHRDIKSANILLDENWNAKIADFGLSKFHPANQMASTIQTKFVAGTEVYLDPEFLARGRYKKESDIYSFGVVLFEILSGSMAYDPVYLKENNQGLAPIARRRFNEGTLKELIDPKMMEEDDEHEFTLNRGPNQDSFDAFSKIAYQCLAETQARRPTMEVVTKELHNALNLQGETMVLSKFQFSDIVRATEKFAETYCIGLDAYGMVYKAELDQFESESSSPKEEKNNGEKPKKCITVAIKLISSREDGQREGFFAEIEMRTRYRHPNIVSLLGFCDKGREMILVYEHASNGSLEDYLRSIDIVTKLSWKQRLQKCLDIARGLNHLHTKKGSKQTIIHGDIKSANILLGKNLETKIAYFGLSGLHSANQDASTSDSIATKVYRDPEYEKTGKLEIKSDIYSFGVILFEMFCGRLAYDRVYIDKNDKGLAPIARRCFNEGTIKNMIDPKLLEETNENIFTSNKGTNQDSLDTFLKTAYKCLGETKARRPRMETVIKKLEKALEFQENLMSKLHISLKDIELATQNFSQECCIGSGRDWKAYKGEIPLANANHNGLETIVAKRWNSMSGQGDHQFRTELDILFKRKHENIIGLVGYCSEMNETIIVYKHASKGSLDEYLNNASLTWMNRLKISIDVASGLEFLHGGDVTLKKVVHRDIKSASILLTGDWKAKISNLELSSLDSIYEDMDHVSDNAYGTFGYLDPEYAKSGYLTEESDIYSFGVILFEILCGKLAWAEGCMDHSQSLGPLAKERYEERKLDEMVFEGIKKKIVRQSFSTFAEIAYQCIQDDGNERPDASEVVIQLKKALEFQEEDEIWEPKLPRNYKEIIAMTKQPDIYHNSKKDLYKMLSDQGIFLQNEKVWFSLSSTGKGNTMISATMFSYDNHRSHKWRSIQKSTARFPRVAKMVDLSNLKIQIKIDTTLLSSDVVYGVRLIFKFCDPGKFSKKLMYVNMKYKMGSEMLHAYFATKREEDDGWMMIELCRFLNKKKDTGFEVSLDSFSRCYCECGAIYVQGLEFKAINNMKHEEIENLKGVKQVPKSNVDEAQQLPIDPGETSWKSENNYDGEELFLLSRVNGKIHLMLCAKLVLYNPPNVKPFHFKPSAESRFQDVVELPRQQVLRIKYKIEIEKLLPFTRYSCYLVFKFSKKCCGLHCPVKVLDLLHRKTKETQILYFRSPAPLNQHDGNWVPKQRKDGWMEVMVWNFNSKYKPGKKLIPMNLQLISYEGTMSGLIICGLEIRPR